MRASATPAFDGQRRLFRAAGGGAVASPPNGRDAAGWGVHRVMGTETEFGIHAPANPGAHHSVLSTELVNAYADLVTRTGSAVAGTEWDYAGESPLVDARGWRMPRSAAHPSQLTDEALVGPDGEPVHLLLSTVLPNGARWYVDHAHPEYSSPETTSPREAMVWDAAGDRIAQAAAEHIAATQGAEVLVYKNNADGKGQSYGAHENYLVARALDFEELAAVLLPFFAARQVLVGAGRVGIGPDGRTPGFQLSQRADFFEEQVGLETTIRRPIVNTRDEPHAERDAYRRLHVIVGDATLSQHATWLRTGMTALVLAMAEAGTAPRIVLDDPVAALQAFSHDPTLRAAVPGREQGDGGAWARRDWTGIRILRAYLEAAEAHCARFGVDDPETTAVLSAWRTDLDDAARDPLSLADRADWAAKLRVLQGLHARSGADWSDPRLAMVDLQYADLRPEKSLHRRLVAAGALQVVADEAEVAAAVVAPPRSTRAWTRGNLVRHHARQMAGAAWELVLVRPQEEGRLHRLALAEPLVGAAADLPGWWDDDGAGPRIPAPEELSRVLVPLLERG